MVMFGWRKSMKKRAGSRDVIKTLEQYLAKADDEGNAYGTLAQAYEKNRRQWEAHRDLTERHRRFNGPRTSVNGERNTDGRLIWIKRLSRERGRPRLAEC